MKNLITLAVGAAFGCACAFAAYDVPYSSILTENGAISPEWFTFDTSANGADYNGQRVSEWAYPVTASNLNMFNESYPAGLILYENIVNVTAPDRLISPAINLEEGKEYRVRYAVRTKWLSTTTFNPAGSLYLVSEDDTEGENPIQTITEFSSQGDTSWTNFGYVFTPEVSGSYRFVYSIAIRYKSAYCCFTNFQVLENVFVPASPSDVRAECGSEEDPRDLSCKLSWLNPTTDADGLPMNESQQLQKILIYRDGGEEPLAIVSDGSTSWVDTADTGLTSGYHTYSLRSVVADATSAPVSVKTAYVGPVEAFELPVSVSTDVRSDYDLLWKYDNLGITSAYGWQYQTAQKTAYCAYSQLSHDGNGCWLFTPKMNFAVPGKYCLVINGGTTLTDGQHFVVAYGAAPAPSAMTNAISDDVPLDMSTWIGSNTEPIFFTVSVPGEYYIGIQTDTESDKGFNYFVRSVDVICQTEPAVFDVEPGFVVKDTELRLSSSVSDARIYYTLDGSIPTEESLLFTAENPIVLDRDMTVTAIVYADGYLPSDATGCAYTVMVPAAPVSFDPESGSVDAGTLLTLSTATQGAEIRYTLDGTEPDRNSEVYSMPIEINDAMTVSAIAYAENFLPSEVTVSSYTITPIAVPESLYIFGEIDGNDWNPAEAFLMIPDGNKFTYKGKIEANGNFGISENKNADWAIVNTSRWCGINGSTVEPGVPYELVKGEDAIHVEPGYYIFTVEFYDRMVTLIADKDPTGGIEGIGMDEAEPEYEYFNLQGNRVTAPVKGEIYIIHGGGSVKKCLKR